MAGTIKRLAGPAFIANAATNIYTPPASTIFTVIRHIHFVNVTTSAATFSLYIGATGGSASGTEIFKDHSISGKLEFDYYPANGILMTSTDFLSGIASAASTLTITVTGEQGVVT